MIFRKEKEKIKVKKESRLKIDRDEEVQEGEIVETEWNLKKIVIGLVVLILLIIVGSYLFLPNEEVDRSALGASTHNLSPTPPLPDAEDVQGVLENARQTLSQITTENLISSQAAIQKVINDLEALKGKEGALDLVCNIVCKK